MIVPAGLRPICDRHVTDRITGSARQCQHTHQGYLDADGGEPVDRVAAVCVMSYQGAQ
jgi:hypothetical protein